MTGKRRRRGHENGGGAGRYLLRNRPEVQALRRRRRFHTSIITAAYICVGAGLAVGVVDIGRGPMVAAAPVVQLLGAVAGGLLTLIGIVISLLFLVIQFTVTAQSPRLNLFRDNLLVAHLFGFLLGVLVNAVVAAALVVGRQTVSLVVPALVITLVVAGLVLLRAVQVTAIRAVQLAPILEDVAARGREVVDALYVRPVGAARPPQLQPESDLCREVRWERRTTRLRQVDFPELLSRLAVEDAHARLLVAPGELLREGAVFLRIYGASDRAPLEGMAELFEVGRERTFDQDPTFAFRLLNDIALRALSPAVNDPYSAIQAIDEIESLLRALAVRDLGVGVLQDENLVARLVFEPPTWDDYLHSAVDELFDVVDAARSVRQRLEELLEHIRTIAPESRWEAIDVRRAELDEIGGTTRTAGS
ncbi:DUF2254 family protein [Speluncibacter jeojiensis]|uniref:DUF2254 domain-containing protein n=1 Tax=Speluncibacter jeojiensis TaxID=2710754 RepID=A0A9X4M219_9ACTN|nr:DUF2254 domain-containing protein [Corynebacteriales bacterium D3-21]